MGRLDIALNPQYTALIGGRGTGKSTILDYIRWALCDQPVSVSEEDELANPSGRQRRLIEATLKPMEAEVEVHCVINGIPHVVRRSARDGEVHLKVGDGPFEKVRESAIQSLLPIQAYSQKQLSSVAIRVDELMRFITTPIARSLEELDRGIDEVAGRLRENYGTLQRFRALTAETERTRIRVRSLEQQAKSIRESLTNLSEEDRETLALKATYDRLRAATTTWPKQLDLVERAMVDLIDDAENAMKQVVDQEGAPREVATEVQALQTVILGTIEQAKRGLVSGAESLAASKPRVDSAKNALLGKIVAYEAEYATVKERSSANEAQLKELARLEADHEAATALLQEQEQGLLALGDPACRHTDLRTELTQAWRRRTKLLEEQCEAMSELSGGLIQATLGVGQGLDGIRDKFAALITGSRVRTPRIDALFDSLSRETSPAETWEVALRELELLMTLEPDAEITSENTPVLSRLDFRIEDQKRIMARLTPDGWLDLSLTHIKNLPRFEYRAKEDTYIPFESASAGQQASALLATLLSQPGMPLIIDQPEDDLDSDTIQQVVAKMWEAKANRQMIFASHNANLVVNGDADLVLVCSYLTAGDQSAGQIKTQGAIDMPDVRGEITTVMEGGERAFKLRMEKYGF
jgi:type III restriction enzyme